MQQYTQTSLFIRSVFFRNPFNYCRYNVVRFKSGTYFLDRECICSNSAGFCMAEEQSNDKRRRTRYFTLRASLMQSTSNFARRVSSRTQTTVYGFALVSRSRFCEVKSPMFPLESCSLTSSCTVLRMIEARIKFIIRNYLRRKLLSDDSAFFFCTRNCIHVYLRLVVFIREPSRWKLWLVRISANFARAQLGLLATSNQQRRSV